MTEKELLEQVIRLRQALITIADCHAGSGPHRILAHHALANKPISERGKKWLLFSSQVFNHIENYTVPQYGDAGADQVTEWTADDCAKQVVKYISRRGRNSRPGQELLDMLKTAHYVQLTAEKDGVK